MKPVNILSIDWDYFFPDTAQYDWGHRESSFFLEAIWQTRPGNRSIVGDRRKLAVDVMRVNRSRIDRILAKTSFASCHHLCVAESHSSIVQWINEMKWKSVNIINADAHHDWRYGQSDTLNCGNWASILRKKGVLKDYTVVYPRWRVSEKDWMDEEFGVSFGRVAYAPIRSTPDAVFLCRSGAWTPTWQDREWVEFVDRVRRMIYPRFTDFCCEYALKVRSPGLPKAKRIAALHLKVLRRFKRQIATKNMKESAEVWTFRSSSNPDKSYQTHRYTDGSTSCNCPGWTRSGRRDSKGRRWCKHTIDVMSGNTDSAIAHVVFAKVKASEIAAVPDEETVRRLDIFR